MELYHENYRKQLERLLAIVNDGKEGYKKAAEEVSSGDLKEVFLRYADQRAHMAAELKEKIRALGGNPENHEGDQAGVVHRAMMAFKTAFTKGHKDDQAVLETCRTGDQYAVDSYDDVLQGSILETDLKPFLTGQRIRIAEAYNAVDQMYFSRFKQNPEL